MKIEIPKLSYSIALLITLLLAGCADAGSDKVAKSATTVVLEGNASTASVGGEIKKYKWQQTSGTHVNIDNNKHKNITFIAPKVETATTLTFKLKTTEEGGRPNNFVTYDFVKVTVQPNNGEDTTAPLITLNGESNMTLHVGETYTEAGATALDDVDGNVDVNMTGEVDTNNAETYTLTYTASDIAGNTASVIRTVLVLANDTNTTDTTAPVITLNGESNMTLHVGETYNEAGATAVDDVDGNVDVNMTGEVNSENTGTYTLTYTASDIAGNIASVIRTIVVLANDTNTTDTTAPVITLNGESNMTLHVNEIYNEEGATALDDIDGNVDVNITGEVDTNNTGTYTLTYTASDSTGNTASVIRTVIVKKRNDVNSTIRITSISSSEINEGGINEHKVLLSSETVKDTVYYLNLGEGNALKGVDYLNIEDYTNFSEYVRYDKTTRKVTVPVGIKEFTISIQTLNENIEEPNEYYIISLSEDRNETNKVQATGTILNVQESV